MRKSYPVKLSEAIEHLSQTARDEIPDDIDLEQPASMFALMIIMFEGGSDEYDIKLAEYFRDANLNPRDPFHWWELLSAFVQVHSKQSSAGERVWTPTFQRKLVRDCVKVGVDMPKPTILALCTKLKNELGYRQTPQNLLAQISRLGLTESILQKIKNAKRNLLSPKKKSGAAKQST